MHKLSWQSLKGNLGHCIHFTQLKTSEQTSLCGEEEEEEDNNKQTETICRFTNNREGGDRTVALTWKARVCMWARECTIKQDISDVCVQIYTLKRQAAPGRPGQLRLPNTFTLAAPRLIWLCNCPPATPQWLRRLVVTRENTVASDHSPYAVGGWLILAGL